MNVKQFKTIDEQIAILRSKGLIINNEDLAKDLLLRENYFFITGYRHPFLKSPKDKTFIEGTTFEELYALFFFDRHFRNVIFQNLLIVENNIKSIMSYQISKKYGHRERDYLREENFATDYRRSRQVKDILQKMKRQVRINGRKHSATIHYLNTYGYIPLWVLVKVLSFGLVSELFTILKDSDRIEISNGYKINADTLGIYLSILSNYRNLCAHEDILYENRTEKFIEDTRFHAELKIPVDEEGYIFGKDDMFSVIVILKQMLSTRDFKNMMRTITDELTRLDNRVNIIPIEKILARMGFPINYADIMEL